MSARLAEESPLLLDWKHRPRTWLKLTFWLGLALASHAACFYLFRVTTSPLSRAMPLPASVTLLRSTEAITLPSDNEGFSFALPVPVDSLDFPEIEAPERYIPSFEGHTLPHRPWPFRPSRHAWPEVSGASEFVLPPAP